MKKKKKNHNNHRKEMLIEKEKEMAYSREMKSIYLPISTGKLIVLMNEVDAKELGVLPLDRVELFHSKSKKKVVAIVDVTSAFVKENEIGIYLEAAEKIACKKGEMVNVKPIPKPDSLYHIRRKIEGEKLEEKHIKEIVKDITDNKISEIELSAFMTSVFIHGFDLDETVAMTKALIENGKTIKLRKGPVLDKHSVGGINGRATMIIITIIASQGFYIPKTSSRSITSSAGTADAMEVLANVNLSSDQIKKITEKVGAVICWGGAVDLAPADDKIIKVEHPLSLDPEGQVVASVMAKKASVGAKAVVIDLPVGPDVKIKSIEQAKTLAHKFIEVGKRLGIKVEAVLTNGSEPSGKAFGPALEAKYVMEILEGKFFDNLAQKSVELSGVLLELTGKAKKGEGTKLAKKILESGLALKKMSEIIKAQGGKISKSEQIELSNLKETIKSADSGEISRINVRGLAKIARIAGAPFDKKAGVMLIVKEGEKIIKGSKLFEIYAENSRKLKLALEYANKYPPIELQQIILEKIA